MRRIALALTAGSAIAVGACLGGLPSPCHEQMIARHGCCPLCDADCRATVDAACADDEHEADVDHEPDDADPSHPADSETDSPELE
jgi:hypothetical protein